LCLASELLLPPPSSHLLAQCMRRSLAVDILHSVLTLALVASVPHRFASSKPPTHQKSRPTASLIALTEVVSVAIDIRLDHKRPRRSRNFRSPPVSTYTVTAGASPTSGKSISSDHLRRARDEPATNFAQALSISARRRDLHLHWLAVLFTPSRGAETVVVTENIPAQHPV
jgi:hypothetical protein